MMKTGLILEGGAYRGIFTTGVLKVLNKYGISFDYIAGVSAGAGNIADYLTKRDDISRSYISVMNKKNSLGIRQLIKSGYFLNIDSMAKEMMTLDDNDAAQILLNTPVDVEIVCSNCNTGRAEYLYERKSVRKLIEIGKASCSIPILSKPIFINNIPYVDGSVTDAIPLKRALTYKKCDKAVIIFTKNVDSKPTDYSKFPLMIRTYFHKKYPRMEYVLLHRTEEYQKELEYVREQEKKGRVFVIRPTVQGIHKFEKNITRLQDFYIHGIDTMERRMDELKDFLSE